MVLIFGGVYQGKLSYAKNRFGLSQSDVYMCGTDTAMPENKKVIYEIDKWILALIKADMYSEEVLQHLIERNTQAIVICNDISCGVVPTDPVLRKWREAVGKSMSELSRCSSEVIRLFCGIATRIK